MTSRTSSSDSGCRVSSSDRDNSGDTTEKNGFSVVAPMNDTQRFSTAGSSASCWVLENRCTSSTNSTVCAPFMPSVRRAASTATRTSLTPALTADSSTKRRLVAWLSTYASVVLPVPGGPHSSSDIGASLSISLRNGVPAPVRCRCPITSSRLRGRIRTASGAAARAAVFSASSNRLSDWGSVAIGRPYPPDGGTGLASMPASRRCAGVMDVGAPVSGSSPEAALGKAITSLIDSTPASSIMPRSHPNALPPCGGGPYLNASSRKPNWDRASSGDSPITSKTACCIKDLWIRMDPPPISYPLHTMSYASASAPPGSVVNLSAHSGKGAVNGWCTDVQPPDPPSSNIGASTTHRNDHAEESIRPPRRPISSRAAPSSSLAAMAGPAAKNTASPGAAPTAAASPDLYASDRFLATEPETSPDGPISA